jgi:predicted transcriptional regulator
MRICAFFSLNKHQNLRKCGASNETALSEFQADFFKALAHPLRISILDALREGELTVNEISQRFDVEQANASQQRAVLRNRKYRCHAQRGGANVYYSVCDKSILSCSMPPKRSSTTI